MESIVNFVAEWVSFQEMKALQGVPVLTSVGAREWQYEDILIDFDDKVWKDLSEDWQSTCQKTKKDPSCGGASVPREVLGLRLETSERSRSKDGGVVRQKKWKRASCALRSSARCQRKPGGTCDDPLTVGSEGSLGLLAFSGLEQSAIENYGLLIGTVN